MANNAPLLLRSWPQAIVHVDGDAFFASCEQAVHPELKGKPVITGQERNIVASMSYEAKALGIKRGTPVWQAKKICPSLIILPSDYETYSLISKKMFSIMRRFSPIVEESSIDEGYCDIYGLRRVYHCGYDGIALKMQDTLQKELGISISVGLSLNKTLSKLAAKFKKPHGFTVVRGRYLHHFLRQVPVGEVCGIGPNTTALLHKRRIVTAFDYISRPIYEMKALWGKIGVELWKELRGEMIYKLNPEEKTTYQSILKSKTFTPPSNDFTYVKAQLFRNAESAFIKLRRFKLKAKHFLIFIKTQDFKSKGLEADFSRGTVNPLEIFPLIEKMLQHIFQPNTLYRSTGIALTKLEDDQATQYELFEDNLKMVRMKTLAHSIDEINTEYGKHTIFSGRGLVLKRDRKTLEEEHGRHALAKRKKELLPGETFRQRLRYPLWQIKV